MLSHPRPLDELLWPREKELTDLFRNEFAGMVVGQVELDELASAFPPG